MPRAYLIEWLDHCEHSQPAAWLDIESVNAKPARIRSVCYVVKTTDDSVVISHTASEGQVISPFVIAKAAIVRMEPLTLPRKRGQKSSTA